MTGINFHQLYIFHCVARLRSFSKAAEELGISQPAVSIQVRELEKQIGSGLLNRMHRGLQLTEAGEVVFGYAQRIFSLSDEMESVVQKSRGLKSGRLSIGSSTTPGGYILPWVIGQFRRRYPGVEVSLSITNTQSVLAKIRRRELDLGMVGTPVSIRGLSSFPYVEDEIVIIAAPTHPIGSRRQIKLQDLDGEDFILREPGSATRYTAEKCIDGHGITMKVVMELGSNEAVKRAVAAGLGLGIISKFGVLPDTTAGFITVLDIPEWQCRRPLTVFHRDDKYLPSAQRAFLRFLQEERPLPGTPTDKY